MDPTSIEYQVIIEDVVAMSAVGRESSPTFRRAFRRAQVSRLIIAAFMGLVVVGGVALDDRLMVLGGAALAVGIVLNGAILSSRIARSEETALRKLYAEGTNPGLLGWHRLSLSADSLVEETEIGFSSRRCSAIHRLSETPDHLFLFIGSLHGRAIAKQRIQSGDLEEFKKSLEAKMVKPQQSETKKTHMGVVDYTPIKESIEPTSIECNLAVDDMVAFYADIRQSSPACQRFVRHVQVGTWSVIAVLGLVVLVGVRTKWYYAAAAAGWVAVYLSTCVSAIPKRITTSADATVRKGYEASEEPCSLGWRRLSLAADGLFEESETGHSLVRYSSVQRVSETPEHLFVYIGSLNAFVIPKQRIQSGDLDEFKAALQARLDKR